MIFNKHKDDCCDDILDILGGNPGQDPIQKELSNIIGTLDQIQHDQNEQFAILNSKLDQILKAIGPTETVGIIFGEPTAQ